MRARRRLLGIGLVAGLVVGLASGLAACGGGSAGLDPAARILSPEARLGERIFHDRSLSASGLQSCAGCHVRAFGHAQNNDFAAQFGGPDLRRQGTRSAPSIRYLASAGAFRFDASGRPRGGLFRDGRADTLAAQAAGPLFDPAEMALGSAQELADRLAAAGYAQDFARVYGADILRQPQAALQRVQQALARYQLEDPLFRPFSSRFDAVLRGQATLDAQEQRGLALFNDPAKGNCAACHPSARAADGSHPLFTDFGYANLGVPRNDELAANADPAHFDLGLCARPGGDLAARTDLCGAFKVPTLRNVALRKRLFHNGRFRDLREAIGFYARRDIEPHRFYPVRADGMVAKFDDLPAAYHGLAVTREPPYDRGPGDEPALSDSEIEDVIAFLRTLTDADLR